MTQLENDVGKKYLARVRDQMIDMGIIFKYAYSGDQVYWGLFPPIRELLALQGNREKEALAYVYITQNVRTEGVLQSDCTQYKDVLPSLLFTGNVEENAWYAHHLYKVTDRGTKIARQVVLDRLRTCQADIEKLLESAPSTLVKFLLKEVFLSYGFYPAIPRAHPEILESGWIACDARRDEHRCLLKDPKIRDWRNRILAILKEKSLTYFARSYVSTRGGEIRELDYCVPPEINEFFTDYLAKKGGNEAFSRGAESTHKMYHFLEKLSYYSEIDRPTALYLEEFYQIGRDESEKLLGKLVNGGIVERTETGFAIKDSTRLKALVDEKFQTLVDYVLGKETGPEQSIAPPPPKPPRIEQRQPMPISPSIQGELLILLGYSIEDRSPVTWQLSKEKNPHALVVGTTGSGKTETLKAIVYELKKRGIFSLILDFHNEYSDLADLAINIRDGVTINPLELFEKSPLDTMYETSSILREIYGLGDQQEAFLRKAIRKSYEDKTISDKDKSTWALPPPNFAHVKANLELMIEDSTSRGVINTLLNRLEPIFDIEIFSKETSIPFERIVKQTVAVQLKDLPTEQVKTAASDFFLRRLWYYMYKLGQSSQLRLYCVIDEGHRLAYEKSPLDQLLREARKYGIGILLASQRPSDFKENVVANVATSICLQCPLESDAKFMAKQLNCNPQEVQFLDEIGKAIVKFSSSKVPVRIQILPSYLRRDLSS